MKFLIADLTFIVFVIMASVIACTQKGSQEDLSPQGMLAREIKIDGLAQAAVTGCVAPLKNSAKATDPMAAVQMFGYCSRSAGGRVEEALNMKFDADQTFTLQCIRSSLQVSGVPQSQDESATLLDFCQKQKEAFVHPAK